MKEKLHVKQYLLNLQNSICKSIEAEDEKSKFQVDKWTRAEGGGGSSRIITDGRIFEKGGVNFSHVHGDELPRQLQHLDQNYGEGHSRLWESQ